MSKKRTYIVLIVIILVFFLVMFLMFGLDNIKKAKYETILIVDDNTAWKYKKNKWINVISSSDFKTLSWKKYKVFENREELGEYYLWHDDKWYAFDDDKNAINIGGNIFAYDSNIDINMYNFEEEEIEDFTYVNKVLSDNNLDVSDDFTTSYKVSFDFDNDGSIEDFYVISNAFTMDSNPKYICSIVFMVKSDNIYSLYSDITPNSSFNGCKPYFTNILDVDNDKVYEFILSCSQYSVSDTVNMLYKYEDNEFKIVISNQ